MNDQTNQVKKITFLGAKNIHPQAPVQLPVKPAPKKPSWLSEHYMLLIMLALISFIILIIVFSIMYVRAQQKAAIVSSNEQSQNLLTQPRTQSATLLMSVNIPAVFGKHTTFLDDVMIKKSLTLEGGLKIKGLLEASGGDVTLGQGRITASNIVYSVIAGSNVTISGDPQNPVISANVTAPVSVTSVQGQTGAVNFDAGTGIGLSGLTINNTGVLSLQGQNGAVTFTQGAGVTLDGLTITNSDPGSAQKIFGTVVVDTTTITADANNDTLTFAAGSGVTLTPDAGTKTITISANGAGASGLTTNGILYADSSTSFVSLTPGTSGYVLQSNGPGSAPSWIAPSGGSSSFAALTTGTNTQATMVVGSGASLGVTGTGTIDATTLLGSTWAIPPAIGSTTANTGAFTTLTATSINGLTVTSNGTNTLNIAAGKAFTVSNSLTLSGTDGTSFAFPATSGTVVTTDATQTLTNKTLAAGSNTITGLTNANLSGTAGISNANLANSSLTVTAGSGLSGGGLVSLGGATTLTNAGVISLSGTANQVNVSGSTGSITLSLPQNIHTAASPSFASLNLTNNTNQLTLGTGNTGTVTMTSLTGSRTYTLPDASGTLCISTGNCSGAGGGITGTGTTGQIAFFNASGTITSETSGFTWDPVSKRLGIGTSSPKGKLDVTGANTGNALAVFNETGDQNIITASASGTTALVLNRAGNLTLSSTNATSDSLSFVPHAGGAGSFTGSLTTDDLTANRSYNLPDASGTLCLTTGNCAGIGGNGDITGVGSMTNGDVFSDPTADDQWLGLGASAGRIEFDDQTTDEINILSAKLGLGTSTPLFLLHAVGAIPGKALAVFDETGDQNILVGSASGTTRFAFDRTGNLNIVGGGYQINGASVLNTTTLGGSIVNSSLTQVGALVNGSITTGFGSILTSNTIQGSDITASGTTGLTASGNGAGLTFSGSSNHDIIASSGVLRLGAATLIGSLAAGGNNVTGIGNLSNSGTVQFSSFVNNGGILYTNGTGTVAQTAAGTNGQCLLGGTTPTWGNCTSTNYWQLNNGALSPFSNTADLLLGGTASSSAKFAFINNATGTPTASISGNIVLNSAGTVQTTQNQTLSLGGNTTGNILLNSDGNNYVGIGTNSPISVLDVGGEVSSTGIHSGFTTYAHDLGGAYYSMYSSAGELTFYGGLNIRAVLTQNGDFGLGLNNTNPAATLDVRGTSGSNPIASLSGQTSSTGLVVDNAGSGALFKAQSSGLERFVINQNGNVGIGTAGTTMPLPAALGIYSATDATTSLLIKQRPTQSADYLRLVDSSNNPVFTVDTYGAGTFGNDLQVNRAIGIGTNVASSYASAIIAPLNTGIVGLQIAGTAAQSANLFELSTSFGSVDAWFDDDANLRLGVNTPDTGKLNVTGGYTGKALTILNETGDQNILVGSASGTTRFTFDRSGNLNLLGGAYQSNGVSGITQGSASCVTTTNGIVTGFGTCQLGSEQWTVNNGAIYPGIPSLDLLLGGTSTASAKFAFINNAGGTPTASISANNGNNAAYLTGSGVLGTTNAQTLQLGAGGTGNVSLNPGGTAVLTALTNGSINFNNVAYANCSALTTVANIVTCGTAPVATTQYLRLANGAFSLVNDTADFLYGSTSSTSAKFKLSASGTAPTASVSGSTSNAALVVDNTGVGDLFSASKSGLAKFTIKNNGDIQINNLTTAGGIVYTNGSGTLAQTTAGNAGQCLTSNAGATPSWSDCAAGANLFQQNNGALSPYVTSLDLLLGGTSTASAKFAFINNAGGGTPTASISGTGNNAVSLTATGILGTTNAQTLQLGGAGTGNVSLNPGGTAVLTALTNGSVNLNNAAYANCSALTTVSNIITCGTANTSVNYLRLLNGSFSLVNDTADFLYGNVSSSAAKFKLSTSGTAPTASVAGATSNAAVVVDNTGVGDLFTASKSGASKFSIKNNGDVQIHNLTTAGGVLYTNGSGTVAQTAQGTSGQCLTSTAGGAPVWTTCSAGQNLFQQNNGTVSPFSNTLDLLVGGTSTASAKFAFINNGGSGTPTASISGASNNAVSLTATGIISTTNAQTLQLGGTGTGNVSLNPGGIAAITALTNGTVSLNNAAYANCSELTTVANIITCGTANTSVNFLRLANGAFSLVNDTADFLFGSAASTSAKFKLSALGTAPTASISGSTSNAALMVDNSGVGDLFTASKSGATKFVIKNSGDVVARTTSFSAFQVQNAAGTAVANVDTFNSRLEVTGTNFDSNVANSYALAVNGGYISLGDPLGGQTFTNGLGIKFNDTGVSHGSLKYTSSATIPRFDFCGSSNGSALTCDPGTESLSIITGIAGQVGIGTTTPLANLDVRGRTGTIPAASFSGATTFAAAVVDQSGVGDLFTASKSGASKFTIKNNGDVQIANLTTAGGILFTNGTGTVAQTTAGGSGQCLISAAGGTPTWATCAAGSNLFQQTNGTVSPFSNTLDLLVGGTSTASAKFAFINNSGAGTPTASISGASNNAVSLTATGVLSTTNAQTLQLGGTGTGNVSLNPAGTAVLTALTNGTVNLNNATYANCSALTTVANIITCGTANTSVNFMRLANGAFSLVNDTADFLFGSSASTSAKFKLSTSGTAPTASISASTSNAALMVDNTGVGDLFTASKSGATKFSILNNGDVRINNLTTAGGILFTNGTGTVAQTTAGSSGQCLISTAGGTPTWSTCAAGQNLFQMNNGAISPFSNTADLLVGGTSTASAKFSFINNSGSGTPTASISAAGNGSLYLGGDGTIQTTAKTTLVLGGTTTGDIQFKPGNAANSLTLLSNGNVGIGQSTPSQMLELGSGGNIQLNNGLVQDYNDLTFKVDADNNGAHAFKYLDGAGNRLMTLDENGNLGIGNGLGAALATIDLRASSTNGGTIPVASVAGATSKAALVVDNSGVGDLFTASKSGATKFAVLNNGDIRVANLTTAGGVLYTNGTGTVAQTAQGSSGQCLMSSGVAGTPTWSACAAGINYVQLNNGAISPFSNTADLLVGGTSSSSAKFAFLNVNSGTPTASISAITGTKSALVLGADSTIQSVNRQTLTIGGNTTGDINFRPGGLPNALYIASNGNVGIGTNNPQQEFQVNGNSFLNYFTNAATYSIATGGGIDFTQWNTSLPYALLTVNETNAGFLFKSGGGARDILQIEGNGRVGIGTTISGTELATLDVRNVVGTMPTASFSGSTTNAGLVVDNSGSGDLISASKSGLTKFTVSNVGSVSFDGALQGGTVIDHRTPVTNTTYIQSTPALGYDFESNTGTTNSNITATFNITGLSNIEGTYANIATHVQKGTTSGSRTATIVIQVNGQQVGQTGTASGTAADTSISNFTIMYINAQWKVMSINGLDADTFDLAEWIPYIGDKPEPGDILTIGDDPTHASVMKATTPYDSRAVGIVTTKPATTMGSDDGHSVRIALAGRVPVKVTTANGTIHQGDPITASAISGVGIKATSSGYIVGRALTDYDNTDATAIGSVMVMTNVTYYNADYSLTDTGNLSVFEHEGLGDTNGLITSQAATYGVRDANGSDITTKAVFSDAVVGNIKAGSINAQKLVLAGKDVNARLDDLEIGSSGSAQISSRVNKVEKSVTSLQDKVATLEAQLNLLAGGSALLNNPLGFTASAAAELGLDTLDVKNATVTRDLAVLGRTTVADLGVTGRVTIGLLGINGLAGDSAGGGQAFASINTSSGPLKLQSEGLNGVDILDGTLTIDTKGNLKTAGEITAKKINIDTKEVAAASLGQAVLKAGDTKVVINTKALTTKSRIFTQAEDIPMVTAVKKIDADTFEIRVSAPESEDVKLNWWIVN